MEDETSDNFLFDCTTLKPLYIEIGSILNENFNFYRPKRDDYIAFTLEKKKICLKPSSPRTKKFYTQREALQLQIYLVFYRW
uniref:Uncharacterized protein n=1 Tax=Lepeophtheirus salmonis TaxID=72036 RepID=A0A0K2UML9_LEPSM